MTSYALVRSSALAELMSAELLVHVLVVGLQRQR